MPGFELFGELERKEVHDVLDNGVLMRYGFDGMRNGHWKSKELESELLILTFVARADGYLRAKEREIIMNFIINQSDNKFDKTLLENEIRRTYCESQDFRNSLKKISIKKK